MEKPRLIDADRLEADCNIYDSWDAQIVKEWLNDQPTVDAIPIEWIREYIKKRPFALAYGMMEAWALEEEE